MYIKQSPLSQGGSSRTINPFLKYTANTKIVNPYIMQRERIILVRSFLYGISGLPRYEFADPRHKAIYSNLVCFFDCFPVDQYTLEWFIQYLTDTETLQNCGGTSFVQSIFQGIGEAA